MNGTVLAILITALFGVVGFLLAQHFTRVEKHMKWSHEQRNFNTQFYMRLVRLELAVFPDQKPMGPPHDTEEPRR